MLNINIRCREQCEEKGNGGGVASGTGGSCLKSGDASTVRVHHHTLGRREDELERQRIHGRWVGVEPPTVRVLDAVERESLTFTRRPSPRSTP
jgi:hypothetical protein